MMKAAEARQLTINSISYIDRYLHEAEKMIKEAAERGQMKVAFYGTDHGSGQIWEAYPTYANVQMTNLQKAVVDKLVAAGYSTKLEPDGRKYVPRGLQDDDGNGPEHQNWVITISW